MIQPRFASSLWSVLIHILLCGKPSKCHGMDVGLMTVIAGVGTGAVPYTVCCAPCAPALSRTKGQVMVQQRHVCEEISWSCEVSMLSTPPYRLSGCTSFVQGFSHLLYQVTVIHSRF
jgi:hypothetical protein